MLHHVMSITLLTTLVASTPAVSQIRAGRSMTTVSVALPKALVGNPYTNSADASIAVAVGTRMRERLSANLGTKGDGWQIATREEMNKSLETWGFGPDAILSHTMVRTFAVNVGTGVFVSSEMNRNREGNWVLTAHFLGTAFMAGHTFTAVQAAGTMPQDIGVKMADLLTPAFKAYNDAKLCYDNVIGEKKNLEAVAKAYKVLPNYGMVTRCLADMEGKKEPNGTTHIAKLEETLKGDSLSIDTYRELAKVYLARATTLKTPADSAKVVETYQRILAVAPTDQDQLEAAVLVFKAFGHPDAADEVANRMLANDSASLPGLDLRSNSCFAQNTKAGFICAVEALEKFYLIDSTKADSTFFKKIVYASQAVPDTAKLELWSARGLKLYSSDMVLLTGQGTARLWKGDLDGAVQNFQMIAIADPENMESEQKNLLKLAVNEYLKKGQLDKVVALYPKVKAIPGQEALSDEVAGLVLNMSAARFADSVKDYKNAIPLAEAYITMDPPTKQYIPYAHYLVAASGLQMIQPILTAATEQKSCQGFKDSMALLEKIEKSLTPAKAFSAQIAGWVDQVSPLVAQNKPGIQGQIDALCK